jgi:hypothetical protein
VCHSIDYWLSGLDRGDKSRYQSAMDRIELRWSDVPVARQPEPGRVCLPWVVLSVGADRSSLLCQYFMQGPVRFEPEVSLSESADRIDLAFTAPPLPPGTAFPAAGISPREMIALGCAIAGRSIGGPARAYSDGRVGNHFYRSATRAEARLKVMPRLTGLAAADAEWILRAQGITQVIRRGAGGVVRAQRPEPETVLPVDHENVIVELNQSND